MQIRDNVVVLSPTEEERLSCCCLDIMAMDSPPVDIAPVSLFASGRIERAEALTTSTFHELLSFLADLYRKHKVPFVFDSASDCRGKPATRSFHKFHKGKIRGFSEDKEPCPEPGFLYTDNMRIPWKAIVRSIWIRSLVMHPRRFAIVSRFGMINIREDVGMSYLTNREKAQILKNMIRSLEDR